MEQTHQRLNELAVQVLQLEKEMPELNIQFLEATDEEARHAVRLMQEGNISLRDQLLKQMGLAMIELIRYGHFVHEMSVPEEYVFPAYRKEKIDE